MSVCMYYVGMYLITQISRHVCVYVRIYVLGWFVFVNLNVVNLLPSQKIILWKKLVSSKNQLD